MKQTAKTVGGLVGKVRFVLPLLAALLAFGPEARAASGKWSTPTSGTGYWTNAPSWLSGIMPNGTGDLADLYINVAGTLTLVIDSNVMAGALMIGDASSGYAGWNVTTPNNSSLTLDNAGGTVYLAKVKNGVSDSINVPLVLAGSVVVSNTTPSNLGSGFNLNLNGDISETNGSMSLTAYTTVLGDYIVLNSTNNSYSGKSSVLNGTLSFVSIANADGTRSALGAPANAADGTIAMGDSSGGAAALNYAGTEPLGHTSDRVINLAVNNNYVYLYANGVGPLVLTSDFTASGVGPKYLLLRGDNPMANTIQGKIVDPAGDMTIVIKDEPGMWVLGGASTHSGPTVLEQGTLRFTGSLLNSALSVDSGAILEVGDPASAGFNLVVSNLTLNTGSIVPLEWNATPTQDTITVTGLDGLTVKGVRLYLYQEGTNTPWTTDGTYNLIYYNGTLNGTAADFLVMNPVPGKRYTFQAAGGVVSLTIATLSGKVWDGGGVDSSWQTGANWDGDASPSALDALTFAGSTRLDPDNDFAAGTEFRGISFDASAGAFVLSGNALNLGGAIYNNSPNTQTFGLPLVLVDGGGYVDAATGHVVFAKAIGDGGLGFPLQKAGSNTVTLTATNTYLGNTVISDGMLQLGDGTSGHDGTLASPRIDIDGGTLAFNVFGSVACSNEITGYAGSLVKKGPGTLTLVGTVTNTYRGYTWLDEGILNVQQHSADTQYSFLYNGYNLGGPLGYWKRWWGDWWMAPIGTHVAPGAQLQLQDNIDLGGEYLVLNGTGIAGSGALRNISGTNISRGTIELESDTLIVSDAGRLQLFTVGQSFGGGPGIGYDLTLDGPGDVILSGGVSTGAGGDVIKNGSGTLTMSGSGSYAGYLTLNQGVLKIIVFNSGSLLVNGGSVDFCHSAAGSYLRPVIINTNVTFTTEKDVPGNGVTYTLGTLTITNRPADVTVNGGNVTNGTAGLTFGAMSMVMPQNFIVNNPVAGGTTLLTLGAITGGTNSITMLGNGNTALGGVWGGSGGLVLDGGYSGTTTVSAAHTFTGGATINNGTLAFGHATGLGLATNATTVTFGPGTTTGRLRISGFSPPIGGLNSDAVTPGTPVVENGHATTAYTLLLTNTVPNTFAGVLQNGGAAALNFTKTGNGALTLPANNTMTGTLALIGGTLTLSGSNSFSAVTVSGGSTLKANTSANALGLGTLTFATSAGTLDLNNGSGLAFGRNTAVNIGGSTIISETDVPGPGVTHSLGSLAIGAVQLAVAGGNVTSGTAGLTFGAVTLSGAPIFVINNPVAGGTTLLTLGEITNGVNLVTLKGNGSFAQSGVWGKGATITGGLTLDPAFTGVATLNQTNLFTGAVTVNNGTLKAAGDNGALGASAAATALTINGGKVLFQDDTARSFGRGTTIAGNTTFTLERDTAGAGGTWTLGALATTVAGSPIITVNAGSNVTSGTAGLTFGALAMAGLTTFNLVNPAGGKTLLSIAAISGAFPLKFAGNGDFAQTGVWSAGYPWLATNFTGTVTLNQANTMTTGVRIDNGTLALGHATGLGPVASATVTFGPGTTSGKLKLNAFSPTIMQLNSDLVLPGTPVIENGHASTPVTLTVNNTVLNTYAGVLQDGGYAALNLTKPATGTGVLILSGTNAYSGKTTISGGTLFINSLKSVNGGASALGNPTNIANGTISIGSTTVAGGLWYKGSGDVSDRVIDLAGTSGGATLDASGSGALVLLSDFTASGSGAKILTLQGSSTATNTIAGKIVNSGSTTAVTKGGAGLWILGGVNPYTGATTINGGTLRLTGSIAGSAVTVNGGGTLEVGVPGSAGATASVAAVTFAAGSAVALEFNGTTNDTIYSAGGVTLTSGGVYLYAEGTKNPWSTAGTYNLFKYTSGTPGLTTFSVLNPVAGKSYVFALAGGYVTLTIGSAAVKTWDGGGLDDNLNSATNWSTDVAPVANDILTFDTGTRVNPTNNYTAGTKFAGIGFLGTAGAFTLSGNSLNLAGNVVNDSASEQTLNVPIVLDTAIRTLNANAGNITVGGVISGAFGLVKEGANLLTLTNANTYTLATVIKKGALTLQNATASGTTAGGIYVEDGAALQFQGGIVVGAEPLYVYGTGVTNAGALRNISGTNSCSGAIALYSPGVRVNSVAGTLTLGGAWSGTGFDVTLDGAGDLAILGAIGTGAGANLTKEGAGTVMLNGANTFTGFLYLNEGTIRAATAAGALGAGTLVMNGGTLDCTNTANLALARPTIVNADSEIICEKNIPGAGVLYTLGTLSITSKTLKVSGGNSTGASAGLTFGATTLYGSPTFDIRKPAGGTLTTLTLGAITDYGNSITLKGDGAFAQGGVWTVGPGGLVLDSDFSGIATLNQANLMTGGVTIHNGTNVLITSATGLGPANAATVTFGPGTTSGRLKLSIGPTIVGLNSESTNAIVEATLASTLTLNNAADNTYAGILKDAGGVLTLTKLGAGKLTLSGASSYSGKTTISQGNVSINSIGNVLGIASALGTPSSAALGTIPLGNGPLAAGLFYTGSGHTSDRVIDLAGTTGGATLDASGTGPLVLVSAFTATGVGAKTLTLQGSSTANNTLSGKVVDSTGATSLTKAGGGLWILNGTNTYNGATAINGGTLQVNGALNIASAVTVANGAALAGVGMVSGNVTVRAAGTIGAGSADKLIAGTLTTGALTMEADAVLSVHLADTFAGSDRIAVSGKATVRGTVNVEKLIGAAPQLGTYTLLTSSDTLTDGGLTLGTMPRGLKGTLNVNTAARVVTLTVSTSAGSVIVIR